jgi:hypothetical protein
MELHPVDPVHPVHYRCGCAADSSVAKFTGREHLLNDFHGVFFVFSGCFDA